MHLAVHHADCFNCRSNGACELQELCLEYGVRKAETGLEVRSRHPDTSGPFWNHDPNKCVSCGKCVRVCEELQCCGVLGFSGRGKEARIEADFGASIGDSSCVGCGNCVAACPVGALVSKDRELPSPLLVERRVRTICGYCGVGCAMELLVRKDRVVGVEPLDGPANHGLLCAKGRFAYQFIGHPDRLATPLARKDGVLVPVSWEEALELFASRFRAVLRESGGSAIAGLSSARCTNEENYLFQKLIRAAGRSNNVDHCARLCHASSVAGLAKTLGSAAMTNNIDDLEHAELILVIGSNTTETHPVIGSAVKRAVRRGARLVVADPRRVELAAWADPYLRVAPGGNVALLNAMCATIIAEGLVDRAFVEERTEGYAELAAALSAWTPERASPLCGVPAGEIRRAARLYAEARTATILYAMGITQHGAGTDGVVALSNLALLAGKLGREGCGLDPLRGQNNVQGACDMGALPDVLPGYRKVADPAARAALAPLWGAEPPAEPGLTATAIVDGAGEGRIRFLYVMGENLALSDPELEHTLEALEKTEFLVVQDLFLTETAALADLVLPAACFAEKDGSFTNTERRVQAVNKAVDPPGEARPDLEILLSILDRLGIAQAARTPEAVLAEIGRAAPIYGGITRARTTGFGPDGLVDPAPQWPCPGDRCPGTPILHRGGFARGKARLIPVEPLPLPEPLDPEYPLLLTTGRVLHQYHTRTMSGRAPGLERMAPASFVELSDLDAARLGIEDGDMVRVSSRRGSMVAAARVDDRVGPGVRFVPFHWADAAVNFLTSASPLDPEAKIPAFKTTAVRAEKA
jgi:formate dehydrogenase major subunit